MKRAFSQGHLLRRIFSMQHELNDIFRRTFGPDPFAVDFDPERWERWMPSADLYERDGQWTVRAELPEVEPEDVSLSMVGHHLVIRGERKPPEGFNPENAIFQECPYGFFERIITLPAPVPEDRIQARYRQGVLYVTLPAMETKKKRIEIRSEEPPEEEEKAEAA